MSLAAWTNPELRERCLFESLHKPQTTLLKAIQYYLLYIYEHSHSNYNNNTSPKFPLSHITNTTHTVAHSPIESMIESANSEQSSSTGVRELAFCLPRTLRHLAQTEQCAWKIYCQHDMELREANTTCPRTMRCGMERI